jgi:hypothetical protein
MRPGLALAGYRLIAIAITCRGFPCFVWSPLSLHEKAKESPNFRFYALYHKVYRKYLQAFAYDCCKANGGAAGVDGQTFEASRHTDESDGWTN